VQLVKLLSLRRFIIIKATCLCSMIAVWSFTLRVITIFTFFISQTSSFRSVFVKEKIVRNSYLIIYSSAAHNVMGLLHHRKRKSSFISEIISPLHAQRSLIKALKVFIRIIFLRTGKKGLEGFLYHQSETHVVVSEKTFPSIPSTIWR
jgi:hypothetical protein